MRQAGSGPILHLNVKIPTGRIKRINWMLPSVRKEGKNKFFPPQHLLHEAECVHMPGMACNLCLKYARLVECGQPRSGAVHRKEGRDPEQ